MAARSTYVPPGPLTALPKSKAASGSRAAVKPDAKPARLYHKLEKPDALTKNPRPSNPTRKANNQKKTALWDATVRQVLKVDS